MVMFRKKSILYLLIIVFCGCGNSNKDIADSGYDDAKVDGNFDDQDQTEGEDQEDQADIDFQKDSDTCEKQCENRCCGDDGCGGICPNLSAAANKVCDFTTCTLTESNQETTFQTSSGFIWENPRPAGITFVTSWGTNPNDVWLIGLTGGDDTVQERSCDLYHYNGVGFSKVSPIWGTKRLNAIWGSSAADVHIVGVGGTMLHFDGHEFSLLPPLTDENLTAIWGNSANNIWVVGYNGVMLHYDGNQWSLSVHPSANDFTDIKGSDQWIWAVGSKSILAFDGNDWPEVNGEVYHNEHIWGISEDIAFRATYSGEVFQRQQDGWEWMDVPDSGYSRFFNIWGCDPKNVFLVGCASYVQGTAWLYDGEQWNTRFDGLKGCLLHVAGNTACQTWAVGENGTFINYLPNENSWDGPSAGTQSWINELIITPGGDMWAAINDWLDRPSGAIRMRIGTSWETVTNPPRGDECAFCGMTSGWAFADDDIWVVGEDCRTYRYQGQEWSLVYSDHVCGYISDLWGASDGTLYGVGRENNYDGEIRHLVDGQWETLYEIPWDDLQEAPNDLRCVWGASSENYWAAGENGIIVHWDGNQFTRHTPIPGVSYQDIWGTEDHMWFVGYTDSGLYYSGVWLEWTPAQGFIQRQGPFSRLHAIDGQADQVLASGVGGMLYRQPTGGQIEEIPSGTNHLFTTIKFTQDGTVFVAGENGAILRKHF
jgi:hypothetical protein